MKPARFLALALIDVAVLAGFALAAWALYQIITPSVSVLLGWITASAVFSIGAGGYASHALPWWRDRLRS